jgi:Nif-specific regulatory protein
LGRFVNVLAALPSMTALDDALRLIVDEGVALTHAETGSLLLLDQETNELIFEVATGQSGEEVVKYRVPPGQGIAGWVVDHAEAVIVGAPQQDPRFYGRLDLAGGFQTRSILAVPLVVANAVIGVVEFINCLNQSGFGEDDLRVALALAVLASLVIDNTSLRAEFRGQLRASSSSYRLT